MNAHLRPWRRMQPLLGTFVEVGVWNVCETVARRTLDRTFHTVRDMHRLMSRFDESSEISRINRDAFGQPVAVSRLLFEVLEFSSRLNQISHGAFDIVRPAADCDVGFSEVEINSTDRTVRFHHPAVKLDLGGIGKGFAVDRAVETLRQDGAVAGWVNAGGDIRAFGERTLRVAVRDPRNSETSLFEAELADQSFANSGTYFGSSIRGDVAAGAAAGVWSKRCVEADALTKVVMCLEDESAGILDVFHARAYRTNAKEGRVYFYGTPDESVRLRTAHQIIQ